MLPPPQPPFTPTGRRVWIPHAPTHTQHLWACDMRDMHRHTHPRITASRSPDCVPLPHSPPPPPRLLAPLPVCQLEHRACLLTILFGWVVRRGRWWWWCWWRHSPPPEHYYSITVHTSSLTILCTVLDHWALLPQIEPAFGQFFATVTTHLLSNYPRYLYWLWIPSGNFRHQVKGV